MKKLILYLFLHFVIQEAIAKKVKFSVDMTGQTVNSTGVHVSGDFQAVAGYAGGDWQSNTTLMTQESGDTNIYSVVVDIPAFNKYEYKFINGEQWYEVEFVPVESRVGYNFNDNRWLYVDSLSNDTTFVGTILFSGNAPAGKTLVRYVVNMQFETSISGNGAHVAGSFQNWNPATTRLYSFGSGIYEIISYVNNGTYQFKYYNGNSVATSEIVPAACAINNYREIAVTKDTVLATLCFSACIDCSMANLKKTETKLNIGICPNPTTDYALLQLPPNQKCNITLYNSLGEKVRCYHNIITNVLRIEKDQLGPGTYIISVTSDNGISSFTQLMMQ